MWASFHSSAERRLRRNTVDGRRSELDMAHRCASSPAEETKKSVSNCGHWSWSRFNFTLTLAFTLAMYFFFFFFFKACLFDFKYTQEGRIKCTSHHCCSCNLVHSGYNHNIGNSGVGTLIIWIMFLRSQEANQFNFD